MNIQGVGHQHIQMNPLSEPKKLSETDVPEAISSESAATVEISEEAKSLSRNSGKANPQQVAEALGAKNFGQALKALREAGVELYSGFVSELVHGDEDALAAAQEALAPPVVEETAIPDESVLIDDQPTETLPENEALVIDLSETNLKAPDEIMPPLEEIFIRDAS